jgi:hypothetical protein
VAGQKKFFFQEKSVTIYGGLFHSSHILLPIFPGKKKNKKFAWALFAQTAVSVLESQVSYYSTKVVLELLESVRVSLFRR